MKCGNRRLECLMIAGGLALSIFAGCTSPPSVAPLLRISEQAMRAEVENLIADSARDRAGLDAARASIADGFDADLREQTAPTTEWIRQAAEVYAAAREELMRQELTLAQQRQTRADNLRAAAQAQHRAIELLERQDQLLTGITGVDLWRLRFTRPSFLPAAQENR